MTLHLTLISATSSLGNIEIPKDLVGLKIESTGANHKAALKKASDAVALLLPRQSVIDKKGKRKPSAEITVNFNISCIVL